MTIMQQIDGCLQRFREGDRDTAFFGLLELEHDVLPTLMTKFHTEHDSDIRAFLVEVIWQHRQPSVVPFLGKTLYDGEPEVWKQAMDGLVALASPPALDALQSARARPFPSQREAEEFLRWIDEAVEQVETEIQGI